SDSASASATARLPITRAVWVRNPREERVNKGFMRSGPTGGDPGRLGFSRACPIPVVRNAPWTRAWREQKKRWPLVLRVRKPIPRGDGGRALGRPGGRPPTFPSPARECFLQQER